MLAKILFKVGSFKDSLFEVLSLLSKTEKAKIHLVYLETKILMSNVHLAMGNHHECLRILNKIETEVLEKC